MKRTIISTVAIGAIACITSYFWQPKNDPALNSAEVASTTETLHKYTEEKLPVTLSNQTTPNNEQNSSVLATELVDVERPHWKLSPPLQSHLGALITQANSGDRDAAYLVAMNLRYCYYAPESLEQFEQQLEVDFEANADPRHIDNMTARFEYCDGTTKVLRQSFISYLNFAAQGGLVSAQEVLGKMTPALYMESQGFGQLEREQFITKREQFIQQQIGYLTLASQAGSLRALTQLANMYHSQNYGKDGYTKAYAINDVILALTDDNSLYNRYRFFQDRLYPQLSVDEIATANVMTEEWLTAIRQHGTIYSL